MIEMTTRLDVWIVSEACRIAWSFGVFLDLSFGFLDCECYDTNRML